MSDANGLPPPPSDANSATELPKTVSRAVDKHMQSQHAVGLAVGTIADGTAQTFFYGTLRREGREAPNENTIFEIGSITKVFTATLLADMHLKNEVNLDDPVNQYLPATARLPNRDGVEVTLRHLATHTSGLPRLPGNLVTQDLDPSNPYAHYTVADLHECLAVTRLNRRPGTGTNYSNLGTGLLGHILAHVGGTDFETLVKRRICEPLGMIDTTIDLSNEQRARLAIGYCRGTPASNWDLPALAGAGALRSSLRDMLRFLQANIEPSATPLQQALELGQTIQTESRYRVLRDSGWMYPLLALGMAGLFRWNEFGLPLWARALAVFGGAFLVFRLLPVGLSTMGLGWNVDNGLANSPVLWHNGGTGGYSSYMGFAPEIRRGVAVLANSELELDSIGRAFLKSD